MAGLDLGAYFVRVGYTGPTEPTLDLLRELHALHPASIVFENLDVLLKRPISLEIEDLSAKLIHQQRGGYCYEQNTLFKAVLEAIGFPVSTLGARVLWRYPQGAARPFSHMVLLVRLGDASYIADVGFGLLTLTAPLRLETGTEQGTPHGFHRLMPADDELTLEAKTPNGWEAVYRISLREELPAHWSVFNWHTSTHPESRFTQEIMAARPLADRRLGLLNNVLSIYALDGTSEKRTIATPAALEDILRDEFAIDLPEGSGELFERFLRT